MLLFKTGHTKNKEISEHYILHYTHIHDGNRRPEKRKAGQIRRMYEFTATYENIDTGKERTVDIELYDHGFFKIEKEKMNVFLSWNLHAKPKRRNEVWEE